MSTVEITTSLKAFFDSIFSSGTEILSLVLLAISAILFIINLFGYRIKRITVNESALRFLTIAFLFLSMLNLLRLSDTYSLVWSRIYQAIIAFVLNSDFNEIIGSLPDKGARGLAAAILYFAPFVTIATILSAFDFIRNNIKLFFVKRLSFNKEIFIFSELNEKSITIAESIKAQEKGARIIFTDVFSQNDERNYELIKMAEQLGAINIRRDITSIFKKRLPLSSQCRFFMIGENESENLSQTLYIIDKFAKRDFKEVEEKKATEIYLFSKTSSSELAISSNIRSVSNIVVKRIDYKRSMILSCLFDYGKEMIKKADNFVVDGKKQFNVLLFGFGEYGFEMFKSMLWFFQRDGYELNIDVYDKNANIRSTFESQCPALAVESEDNEARSGLSLNYRFNDGCENCVDFNNTAVLGDILERHSNANIVFVSLGNDSQNVELSTKIRRFFIHRELDCLNLCDANDEFDKILEQIRQKQLLFTVIHDSEVSAALKNNFYSINCIGDFNSVYSYKNFNNSSLEAYARAAHYAGKQSKITTYDSNRFYSEYNYRSSYAQVIYHFAWTLDFDYDNDLLSRIERRRWKAYMATEGFEYYDYQNRFDVPHKKSEAEKEIEKVHKSDLSYHHLLKELTDDEFRQESEYFSGVWGELKKMKKQ